MKSARYLASEEARAVVSDQTIGGDLAHVEEDSEDQVWPYCAIRYVFDELAEQEIERGICVSRSTCCEYTGNPRMREAIKRGSLRSDTGNGLMLSAGSW